MEKINKQELLQELYRENMKQIIGAKVAKKYLESELKQFDVQRIANPNLNPKIKQDITNAIARVSGQINELNKHQMIILEEEDRLTTAKDEN